MVTFYHPLVREAIESVHPARWKEFCTDRELFTLCNALTCLVSDYLESKGVGHDAAWHTATILLADQFNLNVG